MAEIEIVTVGKIGVIISSGTLSPLLYKSKILNNATCLLFLARKKCIKGIDIRTFFKTNL